MVSFCVFFFFFQTVPDLEGEVQSGPKETRKETNGIPAPRGFTRRSEFRLGNPHARAEVISVLNVPKQTAVAVKLELTGGPLKQLSSFLKSNRFPKALIHSVQSFSHVRLCDRRGLQHNRLPCP